MKQLTTMLLLLMSFAVSYGQDGKPTKEETLQYIKSVVEKARSLITLLLLKMDQPI